MSRTIATPPTPDAPPTGWRGQLVPLAILGALVAIIAAGGVWAWTRDAGRHRALPDLCAGVTAGVPDATGAAPGTCAWSSGGTSYTATSTLFSRTRFRDAADRAESEFRYEREGATNRAAEGSGYPEAFRDLSGVADGAFCLEQYDGRGYTVECTARDSNAILNLRAKWDDSTGRAGRRDDVAQALETFAPTAERLLTDLVHRL
ncbi:hypothetical protein [Dactylosporangium sp. NPDC051541]|uniref:hypothetical protein n=1 Tax=Dactylosporangium sp. NPDC051541 TaxID=3363977 RepID=UPI003797F470